MIVERITWLAQVGCCGKVVQLIKDLNEQLGSSETSRVYSCMFGADDESVVLELEFESMEDRRVSWKKWSSNPKVHEATRSMQALIQSGGVHEMWRLH